MEPVFGAPGQYRATLIPTRPGTYTFEFTGTLGRRRFSESFTSGEDTFDDVRNPSEVEFPAQDPTRGELAERLDRLTQRVETVLGTEPADPGGDPLALGLGIAGLAVGLLALGISLSRGRPRP
jgi:hypothetical protein